MNDSTPLHLVVSNRKPIGDRIRTYAQIARRDRERIAELEADLAAAKTELAQTVTAAEERAERHYRLVDALLKKLPADMQDSMFGLGVLGADAMAGMEFGEIVGRIAGLRNAQ